MYQTFPHPRLSKTTKGSLVNFFNTVRQKNSCLKILKPPLFMEFFWYQKLSEVTKGPQKTKSSRDTKNFRHFFKIPSLWCTKNHLSDKWSTPEIYRNKNFYRQQNSCKNRDYPPRYKPFSNLQISKKTCVLKLCRCCGQKTSNESCDTAATRTNKTFLITQTLRNPKTPPVNFLWYAPLLITKTLRPANM